MSVVYFSLVFNQIKSTLCWHFIKLCLWTYFSFSLFERTAINIPQHNPLYNSLDCFESPLIGWPKWITFVCCKPIGSFKTTRIKLLEIGPGKLYLIQNFPKLFSPRATRKHLNFCQLTYNNNNNNKDFNCQTTQTQCGVFEHFINKFTFGELYAAHVGNGAVVRKNKKKWK